MEERSAAIQRVRRVIERLVRDGTAVSTADDSVHSLFPVAISPTEGEMLRRWVEHERVARTIEVGLGYGISALYICEGLLANGQGAARHVAIDPNQGARFGNCALQFLDEAGVAPLVEHCPEESQIALPRFLSTDRRFDFGFVDGNHRFDGVFLDLAYLGRLVRPVGIIAVDDYQLPAIERAVSFFLNNLGWTVEEAGGADGDHHWAVLRTSTAEDRRPYYHFVDF